MKIYWIQSLTLAFTMTLPLLGTGCTAFRSRAYDVPVTQTRHYDAEFDYSDLRQATEMIADDILRSGWMARSDAAPILMIAGIQNRTAEYIDTRAIADRIRSLVFDSGRVRFISESRREDLLREQGYQAEHASPESQVQVGRQLGASHMMSGSLVEMRKQQPRQVRLSKKELIYYKLTLEITDLQSGELVWTTDSEFAREASKPIIGW